MLRLRIRPRILLALGFLACFAYAVVEAASMPIQARLFPWTIGFIGIALILFDMVRDILPEKEGKDDGTIFDIAFTDEESSKQGRRKALEMFGWIYGFILALWLIGFHVSIFAMVLLYLLRHRERPVILVTLPLGVLLATWGLFDKLLNLPFPPGVVVEWLGWA